MTVGDGVRLIGESDKLVSILAETQGRLLAAGVEAAQQEALWLIEHALGLSALQQVTDSNRSLSTAEAEKARELLTRRVAREPLQYILGTQEFCGLEFEVDPSVLIPRPETELLVQETIRRLPHGKEPILIDVGTGSGCLAVTLARSLPGACIIAVDLSSRALETARRNARRYGVESLITWLQGDLLAPVAKRGLRGCVMTIVSNPPYIQESEWATLQPEVRLYEPRSALVAGPRGTEIQERILDEAIPFLIPGGLLVLELGQGQSATLRQKIAAMAAYDSVITVPDDAGIDRVLIATRAG